jgi:pyruvate dehydrogenase E2 component (dihydrolipoamide acetyltransferase)
MGTDVVMPRLSVTMKEGTVGKWYKKEGDTVEKGEPLVEVVSEKATYDLEAPASGVVRKIVVEAGFDVPVNTVLAVITAPNEPLPRLDTQEAAPAAALGGIETRILASPAAKRLAREQGIDLALVTGTGNEGRIDEEDVRKFLEATGSTKPKVKEIIALSSFQKTSAERIAASYRTAPHSTVVMEVDISNAAELHERLKVSYTTIIVKAVAKALSEMPTINSSLEGERLKIFEDVNVGVAVATEKGLVAPVIRNVDKKTLKEIDAALVELTEKARQARLSREEVSGGTFTVTNLGMYGVDFFIPIINPPEAGILAAGRISEKPVVLDGKVEVRPMMTISLAYDHRIVDGVPAAQFLRSVKEKIEKM